MFFNNLGALSPRSNSVTNNYCPAVIIIVHAEQWCDSQHLAQ